MSTVLSPSGSYSPLKKPSKAVKQIPVEDDPKTYISISDSGLQLKTECAYSTENGKVKGLLTVNEDLLMFDPDMCKEN